MTCQGATPASSSASWERSAKAAIDAGSGYSDRARDLGAGSAGLVEGLDGRDDVSGEAGPAGVTAGRAGCRDSGGGAFGGDGALEFGDGAEDVEDQPAAGSGGVDGFGEGAQLDAAGLEVAGDGEEVGE